MKLSSLVIGCLLFFLNTYSFQNKPSSEIIPCTIVNNSSLSVTILRQPATVIQWAAIRTNPKQALEFLKPIKLTTDSKTVINLADYQDHDTVHMLVASGNQIISIIVPSEQLTGRTIDLATLLFLFAQNKQVGLDIIEVNNNTAYSLTITNRRDEPHRIITNECKPGLRLEIPASYHATDENNEPRNGFLVVSNGYETAKINYPCRVYTPNGITTKELRMQSIDAQTALALHSSKRIQLTSLQASTIIQALRTFAQFNQALSKC